MVLENISNIFKLEGDFFMKKISTSNAPAAIGPYSQAIVAGDMVYTSGQIPLVPQTGEIAGNDIATQARQSMENVKAVLQAADCNLERVVKTTCFLADMKDFSVFNEIYSEYFIGNPARSCVAVKQLPKGVLCEVEAIACLL